MGSGRWSDKDWSTYSNSRSYSTKKVEEIFDKRALDADLNPYGVKVRESRDSADNPESTPVIVALDVTGSMGMVLETMAKQGLNTLVTEIYGRKPVKDPHIMCMGIGDAEAGDRAPLQVTQFEADLRIAKQLEKLFLERGGGGNHFESYALAWYFASLHTVTDSFVKRGKKGYLFTIGDEEPTPNLRKEDIERVLGYRPETTYSSVDLLTMVSREWEVFHLMVEEGSHYRNSGAAVRRKWENLIGQRALLLADHTKLAEVIVSAIQISEGDSVSSVTDSWDGSTAIVVRSAVGALKSREPGSVVAL